MTTVKSKTKGSKKRKAIVANFYVGRSFIVNQNTCLFNVQLLEECGWESAPYMYGGNEIGEYEKQWSIQDEDGSRYKVTVSLRQHENIALLYVNGKWVGRCLYLREAERVVKAIKLGCR